MEITRENYKEVYESLDKFFRKEIDEFVVYYGGIKEACRRMKVSYHVLYTNDKRGIESLKSNFERCLEIGFENTPPYRMEDAIRDTGWTREKINRYVGEKKIKRLSRRFLDKESVLAFYNDLEERKRIAGIK